MEELKSIEASVKSATEIVEKMKAANEAVIADVKNEVAEVKAAVVTMDEAAKKNQAALDQLIAEKAAKTVNNKNKSFGDAFAEQVAEAFEAKQAEIKEFQKNKNAKLTIDLKAVGTMTLSNNLSGDGVALVPEGVSCEGVAVALCSGHGRKIRFAGDRQNVSGADV